MYEIEELEAQWRRFRRKRYMRRGLIVLSILLLLGIPMVYVSYKERKKETASSVVDTGNKKNIVNSIKKTPSELPSIKAANKVPLSVAKPLQTEVPSMQKQSPTKVPSETSVSQKPKMTISFVEPTSSEKASTSIKRGSMQMQTVNVANASVIRKLEKRFPLSRDYDDAMYLAKYYYGKHNYRKAEYWAMQANTVDSSQAESWMIFAKSKAKQGHRKEALKILQAYYDRYGNMEVKLLIDRMRKGRSY